MRILSFDASTSTIGVAIIDFNDSEIKLFHFEFFKPPKPSPKISIFQRLKKVKEYTLKLLNEFKPDIVAIEEFAQFMGGRSGAKTIIPLAVFNRTIGLTVYEVTGKEPIMCNVNSIRAALKISSDRPAKEDMPNIVAHHLKIEFPWFKKQNKKTKEFLIAEENYDVADAMAVGLYCIKLKTTVEKKVSKKHKKI